MTTAQADTVASEMWKLWQTALVNNDTRALSQLVTGPLFTGELYECTWPSGGCVRQSQPLVPESITTIVPVESSYPAYFLAEVETKNYIQDSDNGPTHLAPWLELQILVKHDPTSPWQLAFDTGVDSANGTQPRLLPVDLTEPPGVGPPPGASLPGPRAFDPQPYRTPPVPAGEYLPLLAAYWQSYKTTGGPPRHSVFVRDGYTSGVGSSFASNRQDATHRYDFHFDPGAGSWSFSISSYPMVCGTIVDTSQETPAGGPYHQDADRTNWGMQLPPGDYISIKTQTTHQSCVAVVAPGGLDAYGDDGYDISVTGRKR